MAPWPLELVLRPSRLERTFRLLLHLGAALLLLSLEGWWCLPLLAAVAWSFWASVPRPPTVRFDGRRWWLWREGRRYEASLRESSWRSRLVVLLHFRLRFSGRFLAVPVWRDSVEEETFRRLLVVLKWDGKA